MLEQNGVTERKNRTIVEMARTMLQDKDMPKIVWGEAAVRAVYLLVTGFMPIELIMGQKPVMPIEQNIVSWSALSWEDGNRPRKESSSQEQGSL